MNTTVCDGTGFENAGAEVQLYDDIICEAGFYKDLDRLLNFVGNNNHYRFLGSTDPTRDNICQKCELQSTIKISSGSGLRISSFCAAIFISKKTKCLKIESRSEFEDPTRGILGPNALYDQIIVTGCSFSCGMEMNDHLLGPYKTVKQRNFEILKLGLE